MSAADLRAAVNEFLDAVHKSHDETPWPHKYGVPYGALNKLPAALAVPDQPAAQPGVSEAKDAARYRFILENEDFTTVQPSGYNGGDHVWIEFGFKHPKWQHWTKADADAAVDAAMAAQAGSKTP